MIDLIKTFFGKNSGAVVRGGQSGARHDVRVATCALFVEMANIDGEFSAVEGDHILSLLRDRFGLAEDHAAEVSRLAGEELEGSVDLWRFTNLINQHYSKEEKIQVVELMWRLVYADGHLSEHENYLVHKLAKMLRLQHRELIDAKLAVLQEKRGSSSS
ncbi:MAG: TerB family tellurite resistance protein [Candidatus Krumholzibacteria bacterium]|nr:TerB family tellurite resistance protein [Candidatus Krumholzibacteria bacterium]